MKNPIPYLVQCLICIIALAGGIIFTSQAQAQESLINNGNFSDGITHWKPYSHIKSAPLEAEVVAGPTEVSKALKVTVPDVADLKKFRVGLTQPLLKDVAATDRLTIKFTARSTEGQKMGVVIHTVSEPHRNSFYKDVDLSTEWSTFEFITDKNEALPQGDGQIEFFMAFSKGSIEITNIEVLK